MDVSRTFGNTNAIHKNTNKEKYSISMDNNKNKTRLMKKTSQSAYRENTNRFNGIEKY